MHGPAAPPREQTSLLPIFLVVLIDVLGLTIVLPLLPVYAESFGASALVAALLVPAFSACQLFSGPLLGDLSDHVGRRRVLLVSQAGTLIGFLMIASAQSLWMLFLGRIVDGITAGNLTVAQAYIADNTAPENRARSFALIGIAFGIGFLLGPALTAYLSRWGVSAPLYLAAGMSLTSLGCTATLLPKDAPMHTLHSDAKRIRRRSLFAWRRHLGQLRRPVLGGVLCEFFLYQAAFAMFLSGFALFAERRYSHDGHAFGAREIGLVFAFAGLVSIVVQGGFVGRAVKMLGESRLTALGLLSFGAGHALLGHVEAIAPLLVAIALWSLGNGLLRPSLTSIVTQLVPRSEQGVALGVTQSLASIASIAASPLSGWLIDRRWLTAWGWVAAGFCALALVVRQRGSARHVDRAPPP